jgi:hypothetical protein
MTAGSASLLVGLSALLAVLTTTSRSAPERHGNASIVETARPAIERMAHTATVLTDGTVLVAGGFTDPARASQSAELYDPVARRFQPLPAMIVPRHSHTATRLADGSILIAGGYGAGNTPIAIVERFDPMQRRFQRLGSLTEARAGHIAVALNTGAVLVAGGVGPQWRFLSTAETFDPTTGRFSVTGSMSTARESHAAVPLLDGRILIVGGHRDRREAITLYSSAELYDPRTGTFALTGSMAVRRHKHDAVRLADGRVLVSGGSDERDDRGAYRSTEIYDPRNQRFAPGPPLQLARYKHERSSVLLSDDRVLIAGGAHAAEVVDLRRGSSALVPATSTLAGQFSAVARMSADRVLISGGYGSGGGPRRLAWEFVP